MFVWGLQKQWGHFLHLRHIILTSLLPPLCPWTQFIYSVAFLLISLSLNLSNTFVYHYEKNVLSQEHIRSTFSFFMLPIFSVSHVLHALLLIVIKKCILIRGMSLVDIRSQIPLARKTALIHFKNVL